MNKKYKITDFVSFDGQKCVFLDLTCPDVAMVWVVDGRYSVEVDIKRLSEYVEPKTLFIRNKERVESVEVDHAKDS